MSRQDVHLDTVPERDELAVALATGGYELDVVMANAWADYLAGLPWRWIDPVVQLAVNAHHEHPAVTLMSACGKSTNRAFVKAARAHLASKTP